MIKAAKGLVLVLVDCTDQNKNTELKKRARVTGYPTVVFCDPKGSVVGRLRDRSPAGVAKEFQNLVEKYSRRDR